MGSYSDFLTRYSSELKTVVDRFNAINFDDLYNSKTEKDWENAYKKLERTYDKSVIRAVDSWVGGGQRLEVDDIARVALDNQNNTGTEPQFTIFALEELLDALDAAGVMGVEESINMNKSASDIVDSLFEADGDPEEDEGGDEALDTAPVTGGEEELEQDPPPSPSSGDEQTEPNWKQLEAKCSKDLGVKVNFTVTRKTRSDDSRDRKDIFDLKSQNLAEDIGVMKAVISELYIDSSGNSGWVDDGSYYCRFHFSWVHPKQGGSNGYEYKRLWWKNGQWVESEGGQAREWNP